nr:transmembrane emp24 domain containing protein [Hymenolepis microstoma]
MLMIMKFPSMFVFLFILSCTIAQIDQGVPPVQQQQFSNQDVTAGAFQNSEINNHQNRNVPQQAQPLNPPQGSVPVQNFNQVPSQQVHEQQQMQQQPNGVPPIQQVPQNQFNNVPPVQQQPPDFNAPPVQQQQEQLNPPSANFQQQPPVVPMQPGGQQTPLPQQAPPIEQQVPPAPQQAPPVQQQVPPVPQQAPPVQQQTLRLQPISPPPPPHEHNEGPKRAYDNQIHNSLPPKRRQKKYEPPLIINNDDELDFYSRLTSPLASDSEAAQSTASIRPFLALTVNVTPGIKDCYFYEAPTSFVVDVQVIGSEGGMDIGLSVIDPSGSSIVKRDPASDASVTIAVQPDYREQAYAICLDNRKASYGRKKVYLGIELHIDWHNPSPVEKEIIERMKNSFSVVTNSVDFNAMFNSLEKVVNSLDRIGGLLQRSQRLQQRSRNYLSADRAIMLANKDRVTSWSTFQACILILTAMATSETIQPVDLADPTEKATWQIAHQAAEKISTVYYRAFDKQGRPDISTFFVETSSLIWNGNQVVGRQAIVEFLAKKLPKSITIIHTLSAQPVQKALCADKNVVMVNTLGAIRFEGHPSKMFSEVFFLIKDENLWRIQSSTFRTFD